MLRIHWVELFHILATSQRLHGMENVTTTFINKVMNDQWQYLFWINPPFKEMSAEAANFLLSALQACWKRQCSPGQQLRGVM